MKGRFMIPEIRKILFCTDLSDNARHAFSYAACIAFQHKATVTILHVIEGLSLSSESRAMSLMGMGKWQNLKNMSRQKLMDTIRTRIEDVCSEVSDTNQSCEIFIGDIVIQEGRPVEDIVRMAETGDFDMVVLGARGLGFIADAVLGSTSNRVLRKCSKPVLVVRLPS
jgi:nucleotide-binding universal stress UspA family protein